MRPIVLGASIWGEHHIRMFLDYCLPSLRANGNLPALKKERDVQFIIHTRKEDADRFSSLGEYTIMLDVDDSDKYAQLGIHQNSDLATAKYLEADYHCLMPDFVYSENFFSGMLKAINKGHKAIARLNIDRKSVV